jgi:hypothetical protein
MLLVSEECEKNHQGSPSSTLNVGVRNFRKKRIFTAVVLLSEVRARITIASLGKRVLDNFYPLFYEEKSNCLRQILMAFHFLHDLLAD